MRLRFILSRTFKGLRGNFTMNVSVALVTFVSLVFVGAAMLFQTQIENMKNDWYDKVEVSVFMCPQDSAKPQCAGGEATQEQIDTMAEYLESPEIGDYVSEWFYESKEDALVAFQKQMEGTKWVETMTADLMQASYRVKLENPEEYLVVAEALSGRPGVESVVDQREQLEPLFNMLNRFTLVAGVLAGVMIVTALLLIPSTIRLSAMFRRNETEIMRFVGASNPFIQAPFILEGIISALVGALLAIVGLWITVEYFIQDWFGDAWINIVNKNDVIAIAPWLLLGAVLIAAIASFLALRRYTRV